VNIFLTSRKVPISAVFCRATPTKERLLLKQQESLLNWRTLRNAEIGKIMMTYNYNKDKTLPSVKTHHK